MHNYTKKEPRGSFFYGFTTQSLRLFSGNLILRKVYIANLVFVRYLRIQIFISINLLVFFLL